MSIAAIRSNRGDFYQALVACDLALTVLSDPEYQWIEIDSMEYEVDDVVVGKIDGSVICCQCKKNQPNFEAWSIADLSSELVKAAKEIARNDSVTVCFYSRSEFGAIAKLREYSVVHSDEREFINKLTSEHTKTNSALEDHISQHVPKLCTYEFLNRISFEISPNIERMETLLKERLRQMASNSEIAFNALITRISQLCARLKSSNLSTSTNYRLTKQDLKEILRSSGAMLVPRMDISKIRKFFARTSNIGRHWHRDIAGQQIASPVIDKLLEAIENKKRSVLLTGLPGSGKTCVLLSLQEELEQRMADRYDIVSLFIQSREFADLAAASDRKAQGLPEQWVEQVSRLAEETYVVVVIDSLDVLSIAREYSVLSYFLAQIDQLLLIPNVTVVTACRDFDRRYDRRIASRNWDCEFQCPPLNWESEIVPFLIKLEISSDTIDDSTRDLITNPRELALFIELAQREGSFNVITSHALGQRYLDAIVKADSTLGDDAMRAVEEMADIMLKSRSLSIASQRFHASADILRRLKSLNILIDTHDGRLTFGHQTLLDILVISRAIRHGVSLHQFIRELQPVPFVRPSIRSFIAQLATNDRREFRKQLRAVLTSTCAFHIRRLVAESFSQQIPHDDDWSLIKTLYSNHREVFQVIYNEASLIEWHRFWLLHLVPIIKEAQDSERMTIHVRHISRWVEKDAASVVAFWSDALALDWLNRGRITHLMVYVLSNMELEQLGVFTPIIKQLISMPKPDHSLLGRTIARCVKIGTLDDTSLWEYITADLSTDNIKYFQFEDNLRALPSEFRNVGEDFLKNRMIESTTLLDLAIGTIEKWSDILTTSLPHNHGGFLDQTSYSITHSHCEFNHISTQRHLMDAIEAAIISHAKNDSQWWINNRERLSVSNESSLLYFSIVAFTLKPEPNIILIGRLLCDIALLESELSFELASLINSAFVYLNPSTQAFIVEEIMTLWEDEIATTGAKQLCVIRKRAEYISSIPCHLRSKEAQSLLEKYEETNGHLFRHPDVTFSSGSVRAPFSYEVFHRVSDAGVLKLLRHYKGHGRNYLSDFIGGEQEVDSQLREASSRDPSRFLGLLTSQWAQISPNNVNAIMEGVASYLDHRYGNLHTDATWIPIAEPDAPSLARRVLDELERHPSHWDRNHTASSALEACSHVILDTKDAERLVFLTIAFANLDEHYELNRNSHELLSTGINMASGKIAEALMVLFHNFTSQNVALPELLWPTLVRFSKTSHPAVRAMILRRLPYIVSTQPTLGWELFKYAMHDCEGLWSSAERCLYYGYREQFPVVALLLERIRREGNNEDMETWGRISALSALAGFIKFSDFLTDLNLKDSSEAWHGAASVWTHPPNIKVHQDQCLEGLRALLTLDNRHLARIDNLLRNVFHDVTPPLSIPVEIVELYFNALAIVSKNELFLPYPFNEWLNAISQHDPELALAAAEIGLAHADKGNREIYDHDEQLVQLLTRLFAEAEEREESDSGELLRRVVSLQDLMLSLGVNAINEWLKGAERP